MSTEGDRKEPSSFVETQNPAFDGGKAGDECSTSVASDSAISSLTMPSSETRQTCPNCQKAVEILPGRSAQIPTDLCHCRAPPATPPTEADGSSYNDDTLQDVHPPEGDGEEDGDGDGDSKNFAGSLPPDSTGPIENEQPETRIEVPQPARVEARGIMARCNRDTAIKFIAVSFLVGIIILIIVLALFLFKDQTSDSGNSTRSVTIRGHRNYKKS